MPRTARTVDLAIGERTDGPILLRYDGHRLDSRTAYRWVRAIGRRAGLERIHPHMLRAAFIMAALDAGLVSAAQAVEHYEIARYGTLKRWAEVLGMADAAKLLGETLDEESRTDKALTALADSFANQQAKAA